MGEWTQKHESNILKDNLLKLGRGEGEGEEGITSDAGRLSCSKGIKYHK